MEDKKILSEWLIVIDKRIHSAQYISLFVDRVFTESSFLFVASLQHFASAFISSHNSSNCASLANASCCSFAWESMTIPEASFTRAWYQSIPSGYLHDSHGDTDWLWKSKSKCQDTPCIFPLRVPNPEAPWTTARCNRLIRPLNSKIAVLRKLKKSGSNEFKVSQPDSARIASARTTKRPKRAWSNGIAEKSCRTVAFLRSSTPLESIATSIVSSLDDQQPSTTDEETDPWLDVLGEERARKRSKSTYSTKRSFQGSRDITHRSHVHDQAQEPDQRHLREDAFALSRQGVPSRPLLDQQGKVVNLQANAIIEKVNPDAILRGDFRSCTRTLLQEFRELTKELLPTHWRLAEGLYEHLDSLLRATSLDSTPKNGPRSLFATCLKQTTNFINEEQLRMSEEDPDDKSDAATIVFGELEALSTSSKEGWKPLKEVVRAHGIRLLADAVEESLISLPLARGLVILCLHRHATDEAQVIVKSMIRVMRPLSKPVSIKNKIFAFGHSIALHTMALLHGSAASDGLAFTYQQLAMLFRSGILPIEWVACRDGVTLWNEVIISITQGAADAAEAANLLQAVVSLMYGDFGELNEDIEQLRIGEDPSMQRRKEEAPRSSSSSEMLSSSNGRDASSDEVEPFELRSRACRTVTNMLTVLSSIEILQKPQRSVIQNIGIEAQKAQEFGVRNLTRTGTPTLDWIQMGLTILAFNLVQAQIGQGFQDLPKGDFIRFDACYVVHSGFFTSAGSLICNVARCCAKAVAQDPFYHLQSLLKGLDGMSLSLDRASRRVYDGISLAAAFEFAEDSGQPGHLEWASVLERKVDGGILGQPLRTPHKTRSNDPKSSKDGYRWEEGICEWVAKTPASNLKALKQDGVEDGDGNYYGSNTGDPVDSLPLKKRVDLPEMSPCLKKRERGRQEQSRAPRKSRRAETTALTGYQDTESESPKDEVSRWNSESSDIEDLYSAEADELSASPGPSSSKSSQQPANTPLEPESNDLTRANRLPKHSDGHLRRKRARTAGQLSRVTIRARNDPVQPVPQTEESEDELSVA